MNCEAPEEAVYEPAIPSMLEVLVSRLRERIGVRSVRPSPHGDGAYYVRCLFHRNCEGNLWEEGGKPIYKCEQGSDVEWDTKKLTEWLLSAGTREPGEDDADEEAPLPFGDEAGPQSLNGAEHRQPPAPAELLRTVGLSGTDFLKIELPPLTYLDAHKLVPADHVVISISPPNTGKTFLACEIIASALERGHRVLCYQQEGTIVKYQERLRRALAAHPQANGDNLWVIHGSDINLLEEEGVQRALGTVLRVRPKLTVFDSLAACAGELDENDPGAMAAVANNLNHIKLRGGTAVHGLHHMTKEGWQEGTVPTLRHMRGHSSLAGRVDVAYALVPVTSQTTVAELVFDLYEIKQRDAAKLDSRRCFIAMPSSGPAAEFDLVEIDKGAEAADKANRRVEKVAAEMLEAVGASERGLLTGELREQVSGSTKDKAAALRKLLKAKSLRRADLVPPERHRRLMLSKPSKRPGGHDA